MVKAKKGLNLTPVENVSSPWEGLRTKQGLDTQLSDSFCSYESLLSDSLGFAGGGGRPHNELLGEEPRTNATGDLPKSIDQDITSNCEELERGQMQGDSLGDLPMHTDEGVVFNHEGIEETQVGESVASEELPIHNVYDFSLLSHVTSSVQFERGASEDLPMSQVKGVISDTEMAANILEDTLADLRQMSPEAGILEVNPFKAMTQAAETQAQRHSKRITFKDLVDMPSHHLS